MQTTISATEARTHFGEIMQDAVRLQQPIVVEKAGKPQVVMAHATAKADLQGRVLPNAVEMVEAGRQARDEELANLR